MGIDSSWIIPYSDEYEGRVVHHRGNTLKIYDRKEECDDDDNYTRNAESQAATDQKEEQQQTLDVSEIDLHTVKGKESVPYVVLVQGPPNVGKSLLIKSLVKFFTKHQLNDVRGPVTVVSGKHRRLQFVECPNDVNGMIDAAKYADLVLLCIDASYGFEMETFEFLNLLQAHGFPDVIGILSHLDKIKDEGKLTHTKKRLSRQFWNEIYDGAELFYLSCLDNGMYIDDQIHNLATFISVMKINPLSWQTGHPYVLVDQFEDVTSPERVHIDKKCDRNIVMRGYLRGSNLKRGTKVHIAGVGDFPLYGITSLADPFSSRSAAKMRVTDKERLFYAPMSSHGDLLYDKDAEYIDELNDLNEIEGFRAGTYLKLEVRDVPCEVTKNIDPFCPILVGGISLEEENVGYMQARLKRHSWHIELLRTRDPIIVSVGWRRYQTRPIYAQEGGGNRLHRIHYTPKHADCLAMFWGPLAPPGTGFVAVHNLAGNKAAFRISATGFILGFTQAAEIVAKIVKKRKQVGTPLEIFKKTALVKDMFTSDLEIDWFRGVAIRTARGVRGNVKKAAKKELKIKGDQPTERTASCSCQHDISPSDKVFMRVWKQVGELKNSLDKDDPARRQRTIEQRRAVVFMDMKPRSGNLMPIGEAYQVKTHGLLQRLPKEVLSKKEKGEQEIPQCTRRPKGCEVVSKKEKREQEFSKRCIEKSKDVVKGRHNHKYIEIGA